MNFVSLEFVLFFPLVVLAFFRIPPRLRPGLLLLASYGFYICDSAGSMFLLLFMTVVSYGAARKMEEAVTERQKRVWFLSALGICLSVLVCFKYTKWFLPVGISFYTFQVLSYVIDVYRGEIKAEEDFGLYALFVSFFPQLVAGPIERSKNLLTQLRQMTKEKREAGCCHRDVEIGIERVLFGFFQKLVLADFFGQFADCVYGAPETAKGVAVLIGTVCFAFQIYFDFCGYTDIALGSARIFGITLMENFDRPYLAESIQEFWHRWHISLTRWFTDYLYKPLGGSRKGVRRKCLHIILVFLCSGLWHGMAWHYVVWGLLHGCFLVWETILQDHSKRKEKKRQKKEKLFCRGRTFILVCFAWIFFRAESVREGMLLICHLFQGWKPQEIREAWELLGMTSTDVCQLLLGMGCVMLRNNRQRGFAFAGKKKRLGWYCLGMAVGVSWLILLSGERKNVFLYFQF